MSRVRRRQFLIAAGAFLAASPAVLAQQPPTVPRIGLLWLGSPETAHLRKALLDGLNGQGYVEGRNIVIEDRTTVDRYERLGEIAVELVRLGADVIVTYGGTATQAMRRATSTIPIVMVTGADPVKLGLAATLSRPGGNVTGLTTMGAELSAKRIELLKEAVPRIRSVAVMLNPASQVEAVSLRIAQGAARSLDLQSYVAEARVPADFEATFSAMARAKVDALLVVGSTMFFANRRRIVELAAYHRLPIVTVQGEYAEAGALLSYGPDFAFLFRQSAQYVAKILKGASAAELPFEQSTKLELIVNLKTARELGIVVPQSILLRADRVID